MRPMQAKIIETLGVQPVIDPATEVRRRINFIKDFLRASHLTTLVLGISGDKIPP